jgi:hypothetical protein
MRVESVGSSVYLTAYDDTNLKISKQTEMLGWEDRPSKLSILLHACVKYLVKSVIFWNCAYLFFFIRRVKLKIRLKAGRIFTDNQTACASKLTIGPNPVGCEPFLT